MSDQAHLENIADPVLGALEAGERFGLVVFQSRQGEFGQVGRTLDDGVKRPRPALDRAGDALGLQAISAGAEVFGDVDGVVDDGVVGEVLVVIDALAGGSIPARGRRGSWHLRMLWGISSPQAPSGKTSSIGRPGLRALCAFHCLMRWDWIGRAAMSRTCVARFLRISRSVIVSSVT